MFTFDRRHDEEIGLCVGIVVESKGTLTVTRGREYRLNLKWDERALLAHLLRVLSEWCALSSRLGRLAPIAVRLATRLALGQQSSVALLDSNEFFVRYLVD